MKLSKKLALGCLILSFVMLFGNSFGQKTTPSKQPTTKPQTNLDNPPQDIKDSVRKIYKIENDSDIEVKSGLIKWAEYDCYQYSIDKGEVSNNDLQTVPTTPLQLRGKPEFVNGTECANFNEIYAKYKIKNPDIKPTPIPTQTLPPTVTPTPVIGGGFDWSWILLMAFIGFLVLALLGLVGWLAYPYIKPYIIKDKEEDVHIITPEKREAQNINQRLFNLETKATQSKAAIEFQVKRINDLETEIRTLQRTVSVPATQSSQTSPSYDAPPTNQPPPRQFPVSAEDYLGKVQGSSQTATADMGGILVNDPNRGNEFLIVRDIELPEGRFYAVPSVYRFSAKSDYLSFYPNYYDYENASGGAFKIVKPAIVARVEVGWQLREKGILEIM